MRILIKIGGTLLDCSDSRRRLAREIGQILAGGARAAVVHGGGKQMTRFLEERGIKSQFINGLRVTTPEILDAVLKVFAGTVNHELVAAFIAEGTPAVGLTGMDAFLTEAEPLDPALGLVGKPTRSNPAILELLTGSGYLPVVACVAGDRQGRYFNVNADRMAVACAAAFGAEKLFFLTDVDGVRGPDKQVLSSLTPSECRSLITEEIATAGMRAKLESAMDALGEGIAQVAIAPGSEPDILQKLLAGEPAGTRITAENH